MGHKAEHGEDDEAGVDGRETVDPRDEDAVPVTVVLELVVAAQRCHGAQGDGVREEDLRTSIDPHLWDENT